MKYQARLLIIGALMGLLMTTAAWADDPPGRVARIEFMSGSVSVQPRGVDDWVEASANRPLTNADNVWADKDSRAELNVGTGALRISSETSLTLTNINNDIVQVELHQGALNVHVRKLYGGEVYEIDTPNVAFTVKKSGDYRFDVDPNGDSTTVTVWQGEGEATGQGQPVKVRTGDQAHFSNGTSLTHEMHAAGALDDFDQWCRVRDQREDQSVSAKYVAPGVVGSDDLDDNGTWHNDPQYGNVWQPNGVSPDWAPYSDGQWIWVDPWGWTWQDAYPWGFAPFHYGRWVYGGGYWGWAPGPYWARPWYAPAMVGWFGGPGWGVGFGFGVGFGWGWCPLGWGEPFFPWWGGFSHGYFRNINISNTHITNINHVTNNYFNHANGTGGFYGNHGIAAMPRYATSHNALSTASNDALTHSTAISHGNMNKLPANALHNLSSSRGPASVSPTNQSRLGAKPASARPSSAAASRPTVSRLTPPASPPHSSSSSTARGQNSTARSAQTSSTRNAPTSSSMHGSETKTPQTTAGNRPNTPSPSGGRYVPRPPQSMSNNNAGNSARGSSATQPSRPGSSQAGMSRNVPRPTGPVKPAPRESASGANSGRSYGGYGGNSSPYRGYGERPTYASPRGGGYSAPHSYGGYSGGSHGSSAPHGGGGGSHGGGGKR